MLNKIVSAIKGKAVPPAPGAAVSGNPFKTSEEAYQRLTRLSTMLDECHSQSRRCKLIKRQLVAVRFCAESLRVRENIEAADTQVHQCLNAAQLAHDEAAKVVDLPKKAREEALAEMDRLSDRMQGLLAELAGAEKLLTDRVESARVRLSEAVAAGDTAAELAVSAELLLCQDEAAAKNEPRKIQSRIELLRGPCDVAAAALAAAEHACTAARDRVAITRAALSLAEYDVAAQMLQNLAVRCQIDIEAVSPDMRGGGLQVPRLFDLRLPVSQAGSVYSDKPRKQNDTGRPAVLEASSWALRLSMASTGPDLAVLQEDPEALPLMEPELVEAIRLEEAEAARTKFLRESPDLIQGGQGLVIDPQAARPASMPGFRNS